LSQVTAFFGEGAALGTAAGAGSGSAAWIGSADAVAGSEGRGRLVTLCGLGAADAEGAGGACGGVTASSIGGPTRAVVVLVDATLTDATGTAVRGRGPRCSP
jgi:hypothetical protein